VAGLQRELHVVPVPGHRPAQALLRLADPVLDRVLVQHQPFGRRLIAAPGPQEDQQGLTQAGVVLVIGSQAPQRAEHPGPQQVGRPEHHRHRRDLTERHHPRRGSGGERDGLGGHGLPVGEAEPRGALGRVAEGEMNAGVRPGRAGLRGVERVPDPQRQPGPRAGFVARQEHGIAGAGRLPRDVADRVLKPGDVIDGGRGVACPAHQAHVVLAQPVAQGGLRRAHIDPLAGQQVTDPGSSRGTAVPQPVLPFARISCDNLLGGLVDVPGHDPGHAQRRGGDHLGVVCLPGQLLEHPVGEARVSQPVGAQQRGQRRAALRPPARVFQGRGRGLHGAQVDLVLHDLQAGADVAVDTRGEQREHRLVVAQLRDLPQDHLIDLPGHRGGLPAHRRRDVGHQLGDRATIGVHVRILTHSGEHAAAGPGDLARIAS